MRKQKKTKCAACGETGGRFILRGDKFYHASRCTATAKFAPTPVFPFTTSHLDSPDVVAAQGPLTINNLRELRRYEKMAGVSSDPFSMDQSYQGEKY
jgi:hypothetical protein